MKFSWHIAILALGAVLVVAAGARADSLILDGNKIDQVVVREGRNNYYVQYPVDGTVQSYPKDRVRPGSVIRSADRAELLAAWKARRGEAPRKDPAEEKAAAPRQEMAPRAPEPAGRTLSVVLDAPKADTEAIRGQIDAIRMEGATVETALKLLLRQAGLDYVILGELIYISDAETLRRESLEDVETRVYSLQNIGAETLPKIVLQQPGITGFGAAQGGGGVSRNFTGPPAGGRF